MDEETLNKKTQDLMYYLTRNAARESYREFREPIGISDDEYQEIKAHIESKLNVKLYC